MARNVVYFKKTQNVFVVLPCLSLEYHIVSLATKKLMYLVPEQILFVICYLVKSRDSCECRHSN